MHMQEPVARKLGETLKRKVKKSRSKYQLTGEFVYDVPLLESLKQLLCNEFIFNEVSVLLICISPIGFALQISILGYARP